MRRYMIKIGNKYVESFAFKEGEVNDLVLCSTSIFALKFDTKEKARVIQKILKADSIEEGSNR